MGIPAKFDDTTDVWQKKNGDTWEDCTENTFKGGTYRLKVKLVVDGKDNDTHYLNDGIWGAINGTTMSSRYWHSLGNPTHTANSSYVWMVSPEHKVEGPAGYTVAFDANGGTGNMASVNNVSGNYTLPPNGFTAPAGKQFKAWSVGGVEKAVGDTITVNANTTVTAVWETVPAGHTCDIKPVQKVEPSCTEGGKEAYYKCEGCGKFYEDALGAKEITDLAAWGNIAKLGHTQSDWKSDKDNHWKECTVAACGVIIENSKAAHADANNDGKCDTCEYNVGKTPTNPGGDKPNDNPQTGDNSNMHLWIALLFVSGFGVVTTTVIARRNLLQNKTTP